MNNEIKMSTYFDSPVEFIGDTIECPNFAYATTTCEWEVNGIDYGHAIAHAINNHDRLVEENKLLREMLNDISALGFLTVSADSGSTHKLLCKKYRQLLEQDNG